MKTAALILTATLLFNAMDPALARAATRLRSADVGPDSLALDAYVVVTYRYGKRQKRTAKGWIDAIGETTFTIRDGKRKITVTYRGILWLVISREAKTSAQRMIEVESYIRSTRQTDPAVEAATQKLHAKVVAVMPGKDLDLNKLAPGLYAYAVFHSEGVENAASGRIVDFDPHRVVIVPGAGKGWEIARKDIEIIAVSNEPGGVEQWRTARRNMLELQKTAMHAMSGDELDLASLNLGWHAHVDYLSADVKRSAAGVIVRRDANHIVIRSRKRTGVRWRIRSDEIERLIVTRKRSDMKRWRRARDAMRELQGPRVRLNAPSISTEWIIGRFAGATGDTLEVLSEHGRDRVRRAFVDDFEVSMGRHRHTKKGMAIGFLLGATAAILSKPSDTTNADLRGQEVLIDAYVTRVGVPVMTLVGTLIGAAIETERWVDVAPSRINLSVSPTRDKGLRAALSFHF